MLKKEPPHSNTGPNQASPTEKLQSEIRSVIRDAAGSRRFDVNIGIPLVTRTIAGINLHPSTSWDWGIPPIDSPVLTHR